MSDEFDREEDEKHSMQWAVLIMLIMVSSLFFVGIISELGYWQDVCQK